MKNQVTFSHILAVLSIIVIPLFVWGASVETRFGKVIDNTEDIEEVKKAVKSAENTEQEHFEALYDKLHVIELSLKDKQDRK